MDSICYLWYFLEAIQSRNSNPCRHTSDIYSHNVLWLSSTEVCRALARLWVWLLGFWTRWSFVTRRKRTGGCYGYFRRVQSAKETSTTRPWQSLWFFFTLRTVISVPMLDSMNSFEEVAMRFSNVFNAAIRSNVGWFVEIVQEMTDERQSGMNQFPIRRTLRN